jgi:hypothetical protein
MQPIRFAILLMLALVVSALGQINVPPGNWDGSLNITTDTTIDLSFAADGDWDSGVSSGEGTYDADQWAIVFHYEDVSIAGGATLTFVNHPKSAPVVWIVQNTVTINGTISLDGKIGSATLMTNAEGGPGGFRGGRKQVGTSIAGGGFGPGGAVSRVGNGAGYGGGYGTEGQSLPYGGITYGSFEILPLIGGSGGSGGRNNSSSGGGGGGGAILVAAGEWVHVGGEIHSNGGTVETSSATYRGGGGSGGAIRIISGLIDGDGILRAVGSGTNSFGGNGRIRLEAASVMMDNDPIGVFSVVDPGPDAQIWPDATHPSVEIQLLNGVSVPVDPMAEMIYPMQDIDLDGAEDLVVDLQGLHIDASAAVKVFVTRKDGLRVEADAIFVSDDGSNFSTWTCTLLGVGNGMRAIQARVIVE